MAGMKVEKLDAWGVQKAEKMGTYLADLMVDEKVDETAEKWDD